MPDPDKLPSIYLPHGGGPWHVMDDPFQDRAGYESLRTYLRALGDQYRDRAKALLVISAHWEEGISAVHFGARPGMLYDYGGFPDFTYELSWPAPGAPDIAQRIEELLRAAGIRTRRELERGYDHGLFVPTMVAFPEARIPTAQISLIAGLDPAAHLALGRALEPLRSEGVLIIGSGMSYHNMRGFFSGGPAVESASRRFDEWLAAAVAIADPEERARALASWRTAPGGVESHPRSEHLAPLFVVAGVGGSDPGRRDFSGVLMNAHVASHTFG